MTSYNPISSYLYISLYLLVALDSEVSFNSGQSVQGRGRGGDQPVAAGTGRNWGKSGGLLQGPQRNNCIFKDSEAVDGPKKMPNHRGIIAKSKPDWDSDIPQEIGSYHHQPG